MIVALVAIVVVLLAVMLVVVPGARGLDGVGKRYLAEDYAGARALADRYLARWQLPATRFSLAYNAAGSAHHEGLFDECLERLAALEPPPASLQRHLVSSLRATTLLLQGRDLPAASAAWAEARAIRKWKYDDAISALILFRSGDPKAARDAFTEPPLQAEDKVVRSKTTGLLLTAKRTRAIEAYWRGLYLAESGKPARAKDYLERAATSGMRSIYASRARELLGRAA